MVIGLPPVLNFGSEELKKRVVPDVFAGKKFISLAISEAFAGSDVAGLKTTAVKTEDGSQDTLFEMPWIRADGHWFSQSTGSSMVPRSGLLTATSVTTSLSAAEQMEDSPWFSSSVDQASRRPRSRHHTPQQLVQHTSPLTTSRCPWRTRWDRRTVDC